MVRAIVRVEQYKYSNTSLSSYLIKTLLNCIEIFNVYTHPADYIIILLYCFFVSFPILKIQFILVKFEPLLMLIETSWICIKLQITNLLLRIKTFLTR